MQDKEKLIKRKSITGQETTILCHVAKYPHTHERTIERFPDLRELIKNAIYTLGTGIETDNDDSNTLAKAFKNLATRNY